MDRNLRITLLVFISCFFQSNFVLAQIAVTPNINANALVDQLAGVGIVYSNATLTCPNNASGKFSNGLSSSILLDSGIILTTGRVLSNATAYGVNGTGTNFASVNNIVNGGDANLATAAGTSTNNIHDLCKLEFDFVPTGDTIQFRYRFGSEEYSTYNCSNFNDIFAFFISGPGYPVSTNVALVPGTNIPVSINSINNGTISPPDGGVMSNCTSLGPGSPFISLYVSNTTSTTITYNGLTTLLTAKAAVTPCSTYHMKFAIADLTDHIYDSGVFLEAGSFSSDIATVINVSSSNSIASGTPFSMEGCNSAVITIARPQPKPFPQIVTYALSGTATNGVDISALSGSVTIPAFATNAIITVPAFQDGIIEGTETLIFSINGSLCSSAITETLTMNILEYPKFLKPINDTICNGQSIPLNVIPVPPNPNLTFTWSPSSSLNTSSGLNVIATPITSTTYTITSLYPGCPSVDSTFTINVDPIPTLSLVPTNVTCSGLNNGSILATGTAGLPMTITLMPGGVSSNVSPFTFSNLASGSYTVTISSAAGCSTSAVTNISVPNGLIWTNVQFVNPLCSGNANGSISVSASGGIGTVNYTLMPGAVTNTFGSFIGLNAGSFTVTAVDANGCSISTIINLSVSNAILWNPISATNVAPCFGNNNGAISITATGGTGLLTYTLNPGSISNTNGQFTGLLAGTYNIQVSDMNGCSNSTSVVITQPSALQILSFSSTNILCFGQNLGAINMNVIGGTGSKQYNLMPGGITSSTGIFSTLSAGNYTVIATDANGCSIGTAILISQPNLIQFSTFNVNHVACNGGNTGSIAVQSIGGAGSINYTLLPSGIVNSTGSFSNLTAGNYTVQVLDANGCTLSSSTIILQQALLQFTSSVVTNVDCHGNTTGSLSVVATGGSGIITYSVNPGLITNTTGIFNLLSAGNYTVSATDALGCTNSTSLVITQPSKLQFAAVILNHPACANLNNGSIVFNATGGTPSYLYSLNAGIFLTTNVFSNLGLGIYTLHLKDANGCTKDTIISLVPLSNLVFNNVNLQQVTCKYDNTGSITLSTGGGVYPYIYSLNGIPTGGNSNFLNLNAGIYSIHVIDSIGCEADTVLNITEPLNALDFNNITLQPILCYGDQNGIINTNAIGGTPPYQYAINGLPFQSTGLFTNLGAANYSLYVKDIYGCLKDTIVEIKQPISPLTLSLKSLKEITCIGLEDGEIRVSAAGGVKPYSFTINSLVNSTDSVFLNLKAGTYLIEVQDSNGCKAILAFSIAVPTKRPYIHLDDLIGNICKGEQSGSLDWSATNGFTPYHYTVNGNFIDTISKLNNLSSGNYFIQLLDHAGCKADTTFTIASSTTLEVTVQANSASCNGKGDDGMATAQVIGGVTPYQYIWLGYSNNTSSLSQIKYGKHQLIVNDAENCTDTVNYTIDYIPCCELYMPNAFSPNADGHNDFYRLITYGFINLKSFQIFDRWGKRIFSTNNIDGEWDGKLQGVDSELGTYYYLVQYYCQFSKELMIKKGDFTLLR